MRLPAASPDNGHTAWHRHDMQDLPRTLKLLILWLLLLTVGFVAAQAFLRERERPQWRVDGGQVTLQRGPDGHFHWPGRLDGRDTVFLVDTGATTTALPGALARELNLPRGAQGQSQTAGGTVPAWRSQVTLTLEGGLTLQRWPVTVIDAMDGPPLLGMDVLSRLRMTQERDQMQLVPLDAAPSGKP